MKHEELTGAILKIFYEVYNEIGGSGHFESVYEKAMMIEFERQNIFAQCQVPMPVFYKGELAGRFFADILVKELVILELKATPLILPEHESQLLAYMKTSPYEIGFVLNFGPSPTFKRKYWENEKKE